MNTYNAGEIYSNCKCILTSEEKLGAAENLAFEFCVYL